MKVFLHTNVLLDVLTFRDPFYDDSALLISKLERSGVAHIYMSTLSIATAYYIVARKSGDRVARGDLAAITSGMTLLPLGEQPTRDRLSMWDWNDADDAMQYRAALDAEVDYIVTRNLEDFSPSILPVLSPTDFLANHGDKL